MSKIQEIKKPTIQERIQKRVHEILEPIEVWLDRYVIQPDKFDPDKFKLVDVFKKEQVGGVHARKIMEMYEPQYQEYKDLLSLREKNLTFKEITEDEDNDSEERQLLESYEDVENDVIQKVFLSKWH